MSIRPFTGVLALSLAGIASSSPAQIVREKVAVEVITVRLTARDAVGRRVEDLSLKDLRLTVDGKPIAIETLTGPVGAILAGTGTPESAIPSADADAAEPERPLRTLIFVDEGATHPFDQKDAREELDRYLRQPSTRPQQFMVARFDGRLKLESPWTGDAAVAAAAVRRITGVINRISPPSGSGGGGLGSTAFLLHYTENLQEALLESLAAFPTESAERRLLIVSAGVAVMRPADLAAILRCRMSPTERSRLMAGGNRDLAAAHAREIERATFALWSRSVNPAGDALQTSDVVAKALERDIEIIPVRAEAMDRGDFDLSKSGSGGSTGGGISVQLTVGQAMTEIAESTGAEPILIPKKTAARLQEIGGRAAYVLSFRDPVGDHRYHELELTCTRPGVKVDYRHGYRIPMEDERTLDTVVAGFLQPQGRSDPMNVAISQSAFVGETTRSATELRIDYAPPLETGAGAERPVAIIAIGEDAEGNRTEPIQWAGTAYRSEQGEGFQAAMRLGVAPVYSWSVAVRDQPTGLTSYVLVPAIERH
jgi:VWFA-related protein